MNWYENWNLNLEIGISKSYLKIEFFVNNNNNNNENND